MKYQCLKGLATAATAILCLSGVMSCNGSGADKGQALSVLESYTLGNSYALLGSAQDYGQDSDVTMHDSISMILPLMLNGCDASAVCDSILMHAIGRPAQGDVMKACREWLDSTMADMAGESGFEAATIVGGVSDPSGFNLVQGRIVNMTPAVLTYCISTSSYLPQAANGLETLEYVNYSLSENRMILLTDLFTPEGLKQLPQVIAEQAQINPRYRGEVDIETLPEGNNFYLSSEGEIVFSYQPMEVGPHSLGNVQVAFYPEELVGYMTGKAIENYGLQDLAH